ADDGPIGPELQPVLPEQGLPAPANLLGQRLDVVVGKSLGGAGQRGGRGFGEGLSTPGDALRRVRGLDLVVVVELSDDGVAFAGDPAGELVVLLERILCGCDGGVGILGRSGIVWLSDWLAEFRD